MSRRRPPTAAILIALAMPTAFAVALLWIAIDPPAGAVFMRRGSRIPVDPDVGRTVFGIGGLLMAALVARALYGLARRPSGGPVAKAPPMAGLAPGEPVRWRGRLGWAVLDRTRWLQFLTITGLLSLPLIGLGFGAYAHFTQKGMANLPQPFLALNWAIAIFILGWAAALALAAPFYWLFIGNRWLCEFAGQLVVTDRRMLWITPWGRVAHERDRDQLVGAEPIEPGWIELAERDEAGNDVRRDLRGVSGEAEALAAIRWLLR